MAVSRGFQGEVGVPADSTVRSREELKQEIIRVFQESWSNPESTLTSSTYVLDRSKLNLGDGEDDLSIEVLMEFYDQGLVYVIDPGRSARFGLTKRGKDKILGR